MATKFTKREQEYLDQYEQALTNILSQHDIYLAMSNIGYGNNKIIEGRAILQKAVATHTNIASINESKKNAHEKFMAAKKEMDSIYRIHRKKAKILFADDRNILAYLGISGKTPQTYPEWISVVDRFYNKAIADENVLNVLSELNTNREELDKSMQVLERVKSARNEHQEISEQRQNATKEKNSAFEKLNKWMSRFYAVAKIALADQPHLLSIIGLKSKNSSI
ncbi:MAG: hypothetical protein ACK5MG_01090 [Bacteroidales bacterium]